MLPTRGYFNINITNFYNWKLKRIFEIHITMFGVVGFTSKFLPLRCMKDNVLDPQMTFSKIIALNLCLRIMTAFLGNLRFVCTSRCHILRFMSPSGGFGVDPYFFYNLRINEVFWPVKCLDVHSRIYLLEPENVLSCKN